MSGLILETSTEKGCIVLCNEGIPIASQHLLGGPELSRTLALEVDRLLKRHSFSPAFIAVGIGPGSYTGIRVGAALSKALAFGWNIPLFGFCSLAAYLPEDPCPVLIDARMGGFYVLKNPLEQAALLSVSAAQSALSDCPRIASPHPDAIQKRLTLNSQFIETAPDPKILASLGTNLFLQGDSTPLALTYLSSP